MVDRRFKKPRHANVFNHILCTECGLEFWVKKSAKVRVITCGTVCSIERSHQPIEERVKIVVVNDKSVYISRWMNNRGRNCATA